MGTHRSHYDILNVSAGAEPVVIEAAYRALMKKYHPDQAAGVPAADAASINEAYAVLRNAERRAAYDREQDRREQVAQKQALRAVLQPAPPPPQARGGGFFAWSGWMVALIVCGAFAMLATRPGGIEASVSRANAARIADATPVDNSSQPAERPVKSMSAAEMAVEAMARDVPMPPPATVAAPALVVAPEAEPVPPPPVRLRQPSPAPTTKAPRKRAPAARAKDGEFLEREGYIY